MQQAQGCGVVLLTPKYQRFHAFYHVNDDLTKRSGGRLLGTQFRIDADPIHVLLQECYIATTSVLTDRGQS